MVRHAGLLVFLGAALVHSGCDGAVDGVDEECDTMAATTDARDPPGPPSFSAEVTPSGLAATTFSATNIHGEITPDNNWVIFAYDTDDDNDASFAVGLYCIGTRPIPTVLGSHHDRVTFSALEQAFLSTTGAVTLARWEEDTELQGVWYASGSFDIEYTNESPDNPFPPITLQAVGEFANVVMETQFTR